MRPLVRNALTARERQVLGLVACGYTNAVIADALCMSWYTVRNHLTHICENLDVHNRTGAVVKAMSTGQLLLDEREWQRSLGQAEQW